MFNIGDKVKIINVKYSHDRDIYIISEIFSSHTVDSYNGPLYMCKNTRLSLSKLLPGDQIESMTGYIREDKLKDILS